MVLGVDEVGRGCWAGPVVAGAVILRRRIPGLADSKKLTRLQREKLDTKIRRQAVAFGLGWVTPAELDQIGLTEAVRLAMQRAITEVRAEYDEIVVDGNYNYLSELPGSRCLVKADDSVASVSAASIIAKVARDNYMRQVAALAHPAYQFDRHVGYGTPLHAEALRLNGICDLHRKTFAPVRALLDVI
jgi:ribonuclease HII